MRAISFALLRCGRNLNHSFPQRLRYFSASSSKDAASILESQSSKAAFSRTRNIGIIAHIDAGKTTTTERMLYYSGYTKRIGDVDDGSTVTDFLPAERARGITIQSAAITFNWPPSIAQSELSTAEGLPLSAITHNINLIDTPGHADFTFEVLRSLRILDGAVCILDGVAGVEAQTEKVWTQAENYCIPRIIYINKLDRDGAAFGRTVKEIGARLHGWPAVCQIPWWTNGGTKFFGVGDVIHLRALSWESGTDGRSISVLDPKKLNELDQNFSDELRKARVALVELLSEHDEDMVEEFLNHEEDHLAIPASEIVKSLRKLTLGSPQMVIPVFAGASFRNIGVQPLLDAIVDLLPSPIERPDAEISVNGQRSTLKNLLSGKFTPNTGSEEPHGRKKTQSKEKSAFLGQTCEAYALAFKVVYDSRRGVLIYVRVYSGSLNRNSNIYNTNLNVTEKAPRLLKMYANDAVEVGSIEEGQIGVIVGLKHARTGDTLVAYSGNPKHKPPAPFDSLQLRPITVPPPVFFTSVEPNSLAEEKHVADSLATLLREDPSLNISVDTESGQTHLAGMGELHLEIARDRLINDFKAKANTGKIEISYRESVLAASSPCKEIVDREIAGKHSQFVCIATTLPAGDYAEQQPAPTKNATTIEIDSNILIVRHPGLDASGETSTEENGLPAHLSLPSVINAFQSGVTAAFSRGPTHSFPMQSTAVVIDFDHKEHIFPNTNLSAISTAARLATKKALKDSAESNGSVMMEPVMLATITTNESDLGKVVQDISSARGGQVLSLDTGTTEDGDSTSPTLISKEAQPVIDSTKIYTPPDPFGASSGSGRATVHDRARQITARVPLREMVGYLKHLRSLTGGRGTFIMTVDSFDRMSAQRQRLVLAEFRGDV